MTKPQKTAVGAVTIALLLVGCGGTASNNAEVPPTTPTVESASPTPSPETESASAAPTPEATVPDADAGVEKVEVTVTRGLIEADGPMTDEEIVAAAQAQGMTAVINADDTVTYTMTRQEQEEALAGLRDAIKEASDTFIADSDNSITAVVPSADFASFDVMVDAARYHEFEALFAVAFFTFGGMYQQFAGSSPHAVDVLVRFLNDQDGSVITEGTLSEWLTQQD